MQYQYVRSCIYLDSSPAIHWICYSPVSLKFARFQEMFNKHESKVNRLPGTCESFKLKPEMLQIMKDCIQENDQITLMQLQKLLKNRGHKKLRYTVIHEQRNLVLYDILPSYEHDYER